jgi:hypothetical protein
LAFQLTAQEWKLRGFAADIAGSATSEASATSTTAILIQRA